MGATARAAVGFTVSENVRLGMCGAGPGISASIPRSPTARRIEINDPDIRIPNSPITPVGLARPAMRAMS